MALEKGIISPAGKKLNWDDDIDLIPLGDSRDRLDIVYPNGDINVIESRHAFQNIPIGILGNLTLIGSCDDIENNAVILFFYSDDNRHWIIRFYSDNTTQVLSRLASQWNFSKDHYIHDAGIIGSGDDALLWFNDNYNPPRYVNIKNLADSKYPDLNDSEINLLKPAPIHKPTLTIGSDVTFSGNNVRGKRFQFAYSYIYDTSQESTVSHWSDSLFDYRDYFYNNIFDTNTNISNKIDLVLPVDFSNITKINLYVRNVDLGTGAQGSWNLYDVLDLTDSNYHDNSYYYTFYNDKGSYAADPAFMLLNYDDVPFTSAVMRAINGDRILLAENNSKYSNIDIDIDLTPKAIHYSSIPSNDIYIKGNAIDVNLPIDINILGVLGNKYLFTFKIQKIRGGIVAGIEQYYYEYSTTQSSGGYMSNTEIVNNFVAQINSKTLFNITASAVQTGNPYAVRLVNKAQLTFNFQGVSSSESGQYVTIITSGYIYRSEDYGVSWTQVGTYSGNWSSIKVSKIGQYQIATVSGGYVYVSADYGKIWVQKHITGYWSSSCCSEDGKYMGVCHSAYGGTANYMYISNDYGDTWTKITTLTDSPVGQYDPWVSIDGGADWRSMDMSNSGQYIVCGTYAGSTILSPGIGANGIFVSDDYGVTFKNSIVPYNYGIGVGEWAKYVHIKKIRILTDGSYIYYLDDKYGFVYYCKNPEGLSAYTQLTGLPSRNYSDFSLSDTGNYMAVVVYGGNIFISPDYGVTWASKESVRNWNAIDMSGTGSFMTATVYDGYIYNSANSGDTWVENSIYGTVNSEIYQAFSFSYSYTPVTFSFKENSKIVLAICYYDNFNRSGRSLIKNLEVEIPYTYDQYNDHEGYYNWFIKYQINHLPPSWAVCYQFMYGYNNYANHFTIPVAFGSITGLGSKDIDENSIYTILNISQALDRCYTINPKANVNNFDLQKGDRVRILGYMSYPDLTYRLKEKIDVEILGIDDNGNLLLPPLSSFDEYVHFDNRIFYIVEFYRLSSNINKENVYYYEIGDLNPITNGYHTATTIDGIGETSQDQTDLLPAIGIINFGDVYRFPYYFLDYESNLNGSYYLAPLVCNIESKTSSFFYDSNFISLGRYNTYDDKYANKTEESYIYGGLFKSGDLNYNEIHRFNNSPKYLESKKGKIIGAEQKGFTLEVYQQKKVNSIYLGQTLTTLPDGTQQMNYSNSVLSDPNPAPYDFGCSHIGSIKTNLYSTYFFDVLTSSWYCFSQDGIKNITYNNEPSNPKMKNYGLYISQLITTADKLGDNYRIISSFDPVKQMYLFTYRNFTHAASITLGFHEPTNSWLSFYSFYPDNYFSLNENRFFSFAGYNLYEHHISINRVSTGYIRLHFNQYPADVKIFRSIEQDATQVWASGQTGDITVDEDTIAFQDPDSGEWFLGAMSSILPLTSYGYYENKYKARFLRNMMNRLGTIGDSIDLMNGELLRGKTLNIILRNPKMTFNALKEVTINFEKSK
jgi:hypothetical protein